MGERAVVAVGQSDAISSGRGDNSPGSSGMAGVRMSCQSVKRVSTSANGRTCGGGRQHGPARGATRQVAVLPVPWSASNVRGEAHGDNASRLVKGARQQAEEHSEQ